MGLKRQHNSPTWGQNFIRNQLEFNQPYLCQGAQVKCRSAFGLTDKGTTLTCFAIEFFCPQKSKSLRGTCKAACNNSSQAEFFVASLKIIKLLFY